MKALLLFHVMFQSVKYTLRALLQWTRRHPKTLDEILGIKASKNGHVNHNGHPAKPPVNKRALRLP